MADQTDDEDFAAMFAVAEQNAGKAKRRPKPGDQVSGKVVAIGNETVFVDLGGKAEGVIHRSEVTDKEDRLLVAIGDTVEARVADDTGGSLTLRVRFSGRGPEAKAELQQARELGLPVEGTVTEAVKGGVVVDIAGVRGFCPASQLDNRFVDDVAVFVGQRHSFLITRYEPGPRGNLVLSRRAVVEAEQQKKAVVTRGRLVVGATVKGTVVGFKPFGAFVDLGGIEGMLHVSELGYSRVDKPEDVLAMGQEVEVSILKIEADDKTKGGERISLSLKALVADPWLDATRHLSEGAHVTGKVTRLQPFGAFVEIAPGVEGLVHISELGAGKRVNHPREVVAVGQDVEAAVLSIDLDKRRLSLSLAAADKDKASAADSAAVAHAQAQAPKKLGTFADLVAKKKT